MVDKTTKQHLRKVLAGHHRSACWIVAALRHTLLPLARKEIVKVQYDPSKFSSPEDCGLCSRYRSNHFFELFCNKWPRFRRGHPPTVNGSLFRLGSVA
eukprot:821626-Amphidinium_carterae.1